MLSNDNKLVTISTVVKNQDDIDRKENGYKSVTRRENKNLTIDLNERDQNKDVELILYENSVWP